MQALAGVSFIGLIAVSLVVGTRLLWLSRRTRQLPERALGSSLLLTMGIAYPGMILLEADLGWSLSTERAVMVMLNVVLNTGFLLLFLFTARVFRPRSSWTHWVLIGAAVLFATHVALVTRTLYSVESMAEGRLATTRYGLIALGTAALGYAWSGGEAFAHWSRLRRRARLGLVDPVLCNRVWLWAMLSTASLAGGIATAIYLVLGIDVLVTPSAMLITSITGLGQSTFLWLTFLPPSRYVAFLRRRAASTAG